MKRESKIRIYGKVQEVCFRDFVREQMQELGVEGIAENVLDGSVLVKVKREESSHKTLVVRCHIVPPAAQGERFEFQVSDVG